MHPGTMNWFWFWPSLGFFKERHFATYSFNPPDLSTSQISRRTNHRTNITLSVLSLATSAARPMQPHHHDFVGFFFPSPGWPFSDHSNNSDISPSPCLVHQIFRPARFQGGPIVTPTSCCMSRTLRLLFNGRGQSPP
jgi:hypothetical protein